MGFVPELAMPQWKATALSCESLSVDGSLRAMHDAVVTPELKPREMGDASVLWEVRRQGCCQGSGG